MEELFSAGKAYLKIDSLVKTPLHEFMAVERSGLWAPGPGNNESYFIQSMFLDSLCAAIKIIQVICDVTAGAWGKKF